MSSKRPHRNSFSEPLGVVGDVPERKVLEERQALLEDPEWLRVIGKVGLRPLQSLLQFAFSGGIVPDPTGQPRPARAVAGWLGRFFGNPGLNFRD
jgi:hypothetical protein